MTEQATLQFVPVSPVAATEDPRTSHQAARAITRSGERKRQAEEVLAAVKRWPDWHTSAELAALSGLDRHMVARRLPELADPQNGGPFVVRGPSRLCAESSTKEKQVRAITWGLPTKEGGAA